MREQSRLPRRLVSRGSAKAEASCVGGKDLKPFSLTTEFPRNVFLLTQHAQSYMIVRRFPEALRKSDQVLDIARGDVATLTIKANIAQAEGGHRLDALDARRRHCGARVPPLENVRDVIPAHAESLSPSE